MNAKLYSDIDCYYNWDWDPKTPNRAATKYIGPKSSHSPDFTCETAETTLQTKRSSLSRRFAIALRKQGLHELKCLECVS